MSCCTELLRSRLRPHVSVLTLIALSPFAAGLAGCSSDVTRFSDSPFSSPYASRNASASPEVTGSVSRVPTGRVESRPLPQTYSAALPPPPPRTPSATGSATGATGMASYRPPHGDVTGSIEPTYASRPASQPARTAMAAPRPHAASNTVITIHSGETIAVLSRRYGVSIAEIIQANRLPSPNSLKIGQQIVIPHTAAAQATQVAARETHPAPVSAPTRAPAYGGFHVAGPGDTLNKVARRYRVSVVDLARANRMTTHTQLYLGQRLVLPAHVAPPVQAAEAVAPRQPTVPVQKAAPVQHQQVATREPEHTANLASATATPEPEGRREVGGPVFRWPVRGRIVAAFGAKPNGQQNDGINIAVPEGTPIKAAGEGEVAYAGNELKGYGNLILVRHPNGFVTAYAHASELLVKRGDKVKRGQIIAKSGRTGSISSPQLHFEIRKGSTPVDPTPYLGA
jgi:murein DD-endopeptidase MepM/ murein hydrolase activator NlpD